MGLVLRLIGQEGIGQDTWIFDSTGWERYGRQQGTRRGYHRRKPGRPSHLLKACLGSGYVVNWWNRRGDTPSAHQAVAFSEETRRPLPRDLKLSRVLADSGFGKEGVLERLEADGQPYIVALRLSAWVQRVIGSVTAWRPIHAGIEVAEVTLALSPWKKARRMILVRQHLPTGPQASGKQPLLVPELAAHRHQRYSAYVTNHTTLGAEELWQTYRPRAKTGELHQRAQRRLWLARVQRGQFLGRRSRDAVGGHGVLQPDPLPERVCAADC